jgi:dolichol-phosphate mannosyltransferase
MFRSPAAKVVVVLNILTPSANKPRLSDGGRGVFVLLPVLNEIANIATLLDKISAELAGSDYTIGILDDGSNDGTVEYIRERMRQPQHRLHLICRVKTLRASQRGSALRTLMLWGLDNTRHGIFVEMDGDLSHRPEELPDGIGLIGSGQWDVAIASKYVAGSDVVNRPWGRRMVSKVCSYSVRSLISPSVRDYSNGYRFYTREAARLAAAHSYRYGSPIYLSEILALWLRCGLRITEFKSVYIGRNEGVSKLRIADLVKAAIAIFEIAARYHVLGFTRSPGAAPCPAEQRFKAAKE